jgi:hypothetical protein
MRNGAGKFNLPCHKLATSYLWQGKLVYISYLCNHPDHRHILGVQIGYIIHPCGKSWQRSRISGCCPAIKSRQLISKTDKNFEINGPIARQRSGNFGSPPSKISPLLLNLGAAMIPLEISYSWPDQEQQSRAHFSLPQGRSLRCIQ